MVGQDPVAAATLELFLAFPCLRCLHLIIIPNHSENSLLGLTAMAILFAKHIPYESGNPKSPLASLCRLYERESYSDFSKLVDHEVSGGGQWWWWLELLVMVVERGWGRWWPRSSRGQ
uniref:Uncharacterized protein n=1 Tax=Cucumis melo TaxID=3656 RepID=A0A9I9EJN8_CUCME